MPATSKEVDVLGQILARTQPALGPSEICPTSATKETAPKGRFPFCRAEAGEGARTLDPQLGKLMLYQLSYARGSTRL